MQVTVALVVTVQALTAQVWGQVSGQAAAPSAGTDCYCTDTDGHRVEMQQTACLRVGQRSFIGLCEMSLNVPIWRDTGLPCAMSSRDPGLR